MSDTLSLEQMIGVDRQENRLGVQLARKEWTTRLFNYFGYTATTERTGDVQNPEIRLTPMTNPTDKDYNFVIEAGRGVWLQEQAYWEKQGNAKKAEQAKKNYEIYDQALNYRGGIQEPRNEKAYRTVVAEQARVVNKLLNSRDVILSGGPGMATVKENINAATQTLLNRK